MKKRSIYVFIAATLTMLVPAPGRFVYGLVLILELNLLMLVGTLSISLVKKIKLDEMMSVTVIFLLLAATIFFRQILVLFQPEIVLTLGYVMFLIPLSLCMFGYIFADNDKKLVDRLKFNMTHSITYSIYALLFFLFRDVTGYGTFTFFGINHQIYEKVILDVNKTGIFSMVASIPGALILSSVLLFVYNYFINKVDIVQKAEVNK